jgi:hypothetical protein
MGEYRPRKTYDIQFASEMSCLLSWRHSHGGPALVFKQTYAVCDGYQNSRGEPREAQRMSITYLLEPIYLSHLSNCADMRRCSDAAVSKAADSPSGFLVQVGKGFT